MSNRKVLFLVPYPLRKAPSQRFRIEAFFPFLTQHSIHYDVQVFFNEKAWEALYKKGSYIQKAMAVFWGFLKRIWACIFLVYRYDYIVVHREVAPLGPPIFEWIITKILLKKVIFDFDDAIWIPATSESNQLVTKIKCFWKTKLICKWAYKIAAGNQYLADYALQYNNHVIVVPTCVDTEHRYNRLVNHAVSIPVIGWTGSHSTLKYLDEVFPVLKKLDEHYNFEFLVICNKPPQFKLRGLKYIEWNELTEIEDLSKVNIGIMPLVPDAWSEGKCGFKIIQYLALGIPAVASPVGVNKRIIEPGISGFLCQNENEWFKELHRLLHQEELRIKMGVVGKKKINAEFSIQVKAAMFLGLFE